MMIHGPRKIDLAKPAELARTDRIGGWRGVGKVILSLDTIGGDNDNPEVKTQPEM